ncbi:MAG: 50S ribosomal protein L6 [Christensenellales bacterium]|jgi:large subunit ribosomal protein L6|uniref:Large ribosomal subunit protein uL6 n=1 Tax=Candidatus Avichristensenella intestinipullorum TaxID=2840693 RepID=A0A9D0YV42_9FIRM|nr:50S ribosomal protein L6 [Christensenellales bacterium]HIQ62425.1 50S ribosomal protein L6 [Candidatus Avichristensenella intestinipullorum]
MSRIGKLPIKIPAGVQVTIAEDNTVTVKGPKGTLSQQVKGGIAIKEENGFLVLTRPTDSKPHKAMHGLYRALVHNLVVGVTEGFSKTLEMVGTGYRAQAQGDTLTINIGFSHPVVLKAPKDIQFETPAPTKIVVKGINKQQVGNLAADIRAIRKPEPYLGKGIKYENEHIRRKEGKAGK